MRKTDKKFGFTLVEMIVSMAIFSVVVTVALGALVRIISANKKAQSLQTAMTNLNSAMEAVAREVRVGTNFHCDQTFSSGGYDGSSLTPASCDVVKGSSGSVTGTTLAFTSSRTYHYDDTDPSKICNLATVYDFEWDSSLATYHLKKGEQTVCPGAAIKASDMYDVLDTTNLKLTDFGMNVGPGIYPYLYVRLKGTAGTRESEKTDFDLQTSVSSRRPQQ